jgi:hypothetical protein
MREEHQRAVAVALAVVMLAGCAATSSTAGDGGASGETVASEATSTAARNNHHDARKAAARTRSKLPETCHARGAGLFALPDPHCTPGATSRAVTEANIHSTICVRGYTKTVRPPESVTEPEKLASMTSYGDTGSPRDYEYDHLISLELGGAANDPRNLWPEPGRSPNPKDRLENRLHALVCGGQMTLRTAQRQIAANWVAANRRLFG